MKNKIQKEYNKIIHLNVFSNILVSILFLILALLILIPIFISKSNDYNVDRAFITLLILLIISLLFLILGLTYLSLKKHINKINTTETDKIIIDCKKVKLRIEPIYRNKFRISLIIFKCKENNKNKNYYFIPLFSHPYYKGVKQIYLGLQELNVYKSTNIIKCIGMDFENYRISE